MRSGTCGLTDRTGRGSDDVWCSQKGSVLVSGVDGEIADNAGFEPIWMHRASVVTDRVAVDVDGHQNQPAALAIAVPAEPATRAAASNARRAREVGARCRPTGVVDCCRISCCSSSAAFNDADRPSERSLGIVSDTRTQGIVRLLSCEGNKIGWDGHQGLEGTLKLVVD